MIIRVPRYIVIVRHCETDKIHSLDLSDYGKCQADKLGKNIARVLNKSKSIILASPCLRTCRTSEIINSKLSTAIIYSRYLLSETICSVEQLEQIQILVDRYYYHNENAVNIVVVTHYEVTKQFPSYYTRTFNHGTIFPEIALPMGSGWVIDRENKTIGCITPSKSYNPNIINDRIRWQQRTNNLRR